MDGPETITRDCLSRSPSGSLSLWSTSTSTWSLLLTDVLSSTATGEWLTVVGGAVVGGAVVGGRVVGAGRVVVGVTWLVFRGRVVVVVLLLVFGRDEPPDCFESSAFVVVVVAVSPAAPPAARRAPAPD